MERPNLFQYNSPSKFLSDFIEFKRSEQKDFSIGPWSRKLGLASGTLFNIMRGTRLPSPKLARKISMLIGLREYEHEYWMNLVQLNQSSQAHETKSLIRKCLEQFKNQKTFQVIDLKMFKRVADPLTYAIREIINLKDFQEDALWIKQRLRKNNKLSIDEINLRLNALIDVGLLNRNSAGQLQLAEQVHKTPAEIIDESTKLFYENALKIAIQSVREVKPEERHLSATTFSFKKEHIPFIKESIEEFQRQLLNRFDVREGDEVGQVTIQFVPITQSPGAS